MQLSRICPVLPRLALLLLAALAAGCARGGGGAGSGAMGGGAGGGFEGMRLRGAPGMAPGKIAAIEEAAGRREGFVLAMPYSSEAFPLGDGSAGGFAAHLAEWLGGLFGAPFSARVAEPGELLEGLASGAIDFAAGLFPEGGQGGLFLAGPVSERPLAALSMAFAEPRDPLSPMRFAFAEGSPARGMAAPLLPEGSAALAAACLAEAYRLLRAGEADAVIDKAAALAAFKRYPDLRADYFLPFASAPVFLAAKSPDLEPLVRALQAALDAGAGAHLRRLRDRGHTEYLRHRLQMRLSEGEREFIARRGPESPVLVAADSASYPAAFFNRRSGRWEGTAFDILAEITRHTGLYFAVANEPGAPRAELEQMALDGRASMLAEFVPARGAGQGLALAGEPFQRDHFALISAEGRPPVAIGDVRASRVGLVAGSAAAHAFGEWFPGHELQSKFPCGASAFRGLFRGEVDLVMGASRHVLAGVHYLERPAFRAALAFEGSRADSFFAFAEGEEKLRSIVSMAQPLADARAIAARWEFKALDHRARVAEARLPWLIGTAALLLAALLLLIALMSRMRREGRRLEALVDEQTRDLQAASEEAVAASYVKSEFLANMSHEIRTPLNAIIGMTAIARSSDDLERIYDCLRKIEGASQQLMKVINDVLDISKIEAGKFEMARDPFVFADMIGNVKNVIEVRANEKKLRFDVDFDEGIPSVLIGDELRLSQVLLNLLSNAVKFTPEDGSVRFAARRVSRRGGREVIEFLVRDSGIGISQEQQRKIFDAFAQADSGVANRFGGTGLGLPISKSFVELMGGEIFTESSLGMGTCFTAQIPFELGDPEFAQRAHGAGGERPEERSYAGRALLLVEDVEINREIIVALLEGTGAEIDSAENGQIAIDMFSAAPERYDLIFMDIQMPVLDGYFATRAIRALDAPRARTIPIVAMTANAFADDVERCREAGMNDHIAKPIDVEILMGIADKYLAGPRQQR